MKLFGGPSEPEASLGELGSRKTKEKMPPFFGIFHILDRNTEWSSVSCCNWSSTP